VPVLMKGVRRDLGEANFRQRRVHPLLRSKLKKSGPCGRATSMLPRARTAL
jgi:hypothetical protein